MSDVDLMALGSARFDRVVESLMPVGERLRREINPVVMTLGEFRAQLKAHPADAGEIARLLAAAERCIADARQPSSD